jgi:hypothetical protein
MINWLHKLNVSDVFDNDGMSITEKRDVIVARIKASSWFKKFAEDEDDGLDLTDIIDTLSDVTTVADFDEVWAAFYDWADTGHRLWIDT